jgi:hypothetical protein
MGGAAGQQALVALGTLGLAIFTAWLAFATNNLVVPHSC